MFARRAKETFLLMSCVGIVFTCFGCHYDDKSTYYYPGYSIRVTSRANERWRHIQFIPDPNMTAFNVHIISGQIPGWLVATTDLVFIVPSETVASGKIVPINQLNMWNVAMPYVPGRGHITQGNVVIEEVASSKIGIRIETPDGLLWSKLSDKHTFRKAKPDRISETPIDGLVE